MADIKFHLRQLKEEKETPILIRVFIKGNEIKCSTFEKCLPTLWDRVEGRPIKDKRNKILNDRLDFLKDCGNRTLNYFNLVENRIPNSREFQEKFYEISELKKGIILKDHSASENISLLQFFEKIISELPTRYNEKTGRVISPNTIKCHCQCFNLLKEFNDKKRKVDFQFIDLDFLQDFKLFMSSKRHSQNTMAKHIKTLKSILNEATEREYNTNLKYKNKKFTVPQEETEAIYLNENELEELYELNLSNSPKLERVRDLFLVGCWTGLRFSDFSNIRPENVDGGFIKIKTQKTNEPIIVPIHEMVKAIMRKYEGKYFNSLPPSISNQNMNEYLKLIGQRVDSLKMKIEVTKRVGDVKVIKTFYKFQKLVTHTARRSFATNLYNQKFPVHNIMKITGHRTEKAFLKYIRATPIEYAETLKLHWDSQSKMKIS